MPTSADFACLPLAGNDRAAVLEAARVLADHLPVQHRHHCIISPLRLSADEWYHGVYQVLGIREEIDRDGVDVPLPSSSR